MTRRETWLLYAYSALLGAFLFDSGTVPRWLAATLSIMAAVACVVITICWRIDSRGQP